MKQVVFGIFLSLTFALSVFAKPGEIRKPNINFEASTTKNIAVIKINTKTGSNDFATKPVASVVTDARKTWGDVRDDPAPWYEDCTVTVTDGNKKEVLTKTAAKVKVRGNWTTSYDKKPFRIRFAEKQPMLGMNKGQKNRDWVLLAPYKDWSYLRDATGLYLGNMMAPGYTSDFRLAELYLNGEYWGVYIVAEQQEVCDDRVNITEPKKGYKGTDIGYFFEYDAYSPAEKNSFKINYKAKLKDINGTEIKNLQEGYTIKSTITDKSQKKFIESYMNNAWKICYDAAYNNTFQEFKADYKDIVKSKAKNSYDCVSKIIDIDSMVAAYIISEIACDPDLYYSSFYMSVDFGATGDKKIRFEAPWDFDSTMGNKKHCKDAQGLYAAAWQRDVNYNDTETFANPWMMVFVNCDWFQKLVREKWNSMQKDKILSKLVANIDFATKNYKSNFKADNKRWGHVGINNPEVSHEYCEESLACKNQADAAKRLKKWLTTRFKYLDSVWAKK